MRSTAWAPLFLLLALLGCGPKREAAPLKIASSQASLSPAGVSETQKIFDVYAKNGRLTLKEIRTVGARLSPHLAEYLDKLELQDTAPTTYNAKEFFALLGESNAVLRWGSEYDLHTVAGWEKALASEYPESSAEVRQALIAQLERFYLAPLRGHASASRAVLARLLKLGIGFNSFASVQLSEGTPLKHVAQNLWLAHGPASTKVEFTEDSEGVLKLLLVTQYMELQDGAQSDPLELAGRAPDELSEWLLGHLKDAAAALYPSLNPKHLALIYWAALAHGVESVAKGADGIQRRARSFPQASGLIASDSSPSTLDWTAQWLYEHTARTCQGFVLKTELVNWERLLRERRAELNPFAADYCGVITGSAEGSRAK